jgi:hypothetical protein
MHLHVIQEISYVKKVAIRAIILFAILCFMITPFLGCHKETEQEKVRKVIANLQKAVSGN